jgi:hypothetical protein
MVANVTKKMMHLVKEETQRQNEPFEMEEEEEEEVRSSHCRIVHRVQGEGHALNETSIELSGTIDQ